MTKIAFIAVEPHEKKFFTEKLQGHELQFVKDQDWNKINPETEILSVFVDFEVTRDVMDHLPNLKLVTCRSTGFNNVDLTIANKRGIIVSNTPGYGASSVAEFTFALILSLSRKMNTVIKESYDNDEEVDRIAERGFDLSGKTIGIIGLGAIGRSVAKIAHGFGMEILAVNRSIDQEFADKYNIQYTELVEICRKSDIVTLHVPYSPENHHLLSDKLLSEMKPNALIINTSRGELLNTLSLARLMKNKKLGGAGLDVIENEEYLTSPNALINLALIGDEFAVDKLKHTLAMLSLTRMPNVIITNHNAFNTVEAIQLINDMTIDNINGFLTGGEIFTVNQQA